ncbi:MAG: NHL repeat-containing protein [Planctomycetes bacterium]|nr:NHL repeat-containing protein [Planctomycetota bacterium]
MLARPAAVLALAAVVAAQVPLPPRHTGNLFASGYQSHNVAEYTAEGVLVRTFTPAGLRNPRGVAIDDGGNVVVVGEINARVLVLDPFGNVLRTVTHPDLTAGTGIARGPNGHWYVGNFNPGRIVVFDAAWNHVQTRTVTGMNGVNCVAFDADGKHAVTAALANAVYRFDANGALLGTTMHPNMGSPMSIAIDSQGQHYVSQGSTGVIIKFDANWQPVTTFGAGALALPQGIAIDERDRLTISNFSAPTIHRYDTAGTLLGSFAASGVTTARNLAFQIAPFVLARHGTVDRRNGAAEPVLRVNGATGDALGRIATATTAPLTVTMAASSAGPLLAPFLLYAALGEPGPAAATLLPLDAGWFAFPPPMLGGSAVLLANSLGHPTLLGVGLLPATAAPGTVLALPAGLGLPLQVTLQGVLADFGSNSPFALSATNAIALVVQ